MATFTINNTRNAFIKHFQDKCFKSWDELQTTLNKFEQETGSSFKPKSANTVASVNLKRKTLIPDHFKYSSVKMVCYHSGRKSERGGKGNCSVKRYFAVNCPAFFNVGYSKGSLKVTKFFMCHQNHKLDIKSNRAFKSQWKQDQRLQAKKKEGGITESAQCISHNEPRECVSDNKDTPALTGEREQARDSDSSEWSIDLELDVDSSCLEDKESLKNRRRNSASTVPDFHGKQSLAVKGKLQNRLSKVASVKIKKKVSERDSTEFGTTFPSVQFTKGLEPSTPSSTHSQLASKQFLLGQLSQSINTTENCVNSAKTSTNCETVFEPYIPKQRKTTRACEFEPCETQESNPCPLQTSPGTSSCQETRIKVEELSQNFTLFQKESFKTLKLLLQKVDSWPKTENEVYGQLIGKKLDNIKDKGKQETLKLNILNLIREAVPEDSK